MRTFILLSLTFFISCSHSPCGHHLSLDRYSHELGQLEYLFNTGEAGLEEINRQARKLTDIGTDLLFDYRQRHPQCHEFADHLIIHQGAMLSMSLSQLEQLYHEGEALPQTHEQCLPAKDLIVRPQTIRLLARQSLLEDLDYESEIKAELNILSQSFQLFSQHFQQTSR